MKRVIHYSVIFILVTSLASFVTADSNQSHDNSLQQGTLINAALQQEMSIATSGLDSTILDIMQSENCPGVAAAVVWGGEVIWHNEYGLAYDYPPIPVTESTYFQIRSISKSVTGAALMQLYENVLFDLDDEINQYLPFQVNNPQCDPLVEAITFRQILTHTSSILGISEGFGIYGAADPEIPLGEFLEDYLVPGGEYYSEDHYHSILCPGQEFIYSGINTGLAANLIEHMAGVPFPDYCRDSIFLPLGMTGTSWFFSDFDTMQIALPEPYGHSSGLNYPPISLITTAPQLAQFLIAFLEYGEANGTRILDSSTVELMTSVHACCNGNSTGQGLFFYRLSILGFDFWGHTGAGMNSMFFCRGCANGTGSGVVVLTRGPQDSPVDDLIVQELFYYAADYDGDGLLTGEDNCPETENPEQIDTDDDGLGDVCDNCPDTQNPEQEDHDGDGIGLLCDECTDTDHDGFGNPGYANNICPDDNCPDIYNMDQADLDEDGIGDICDNCPGSYNPDQTLDEDADGVGDACDICPGFDDLSDYDTDTVPDSCDNCPEVANPGQEDENENGIGDVCDFVCGDANGDENVNVGDAVFLINYVFKGGPAPDPVCEGDANGDGGLNVGDAVYLIAYIFKGGPAPVDGCCQ